MLADNQRGNDLYSYEIATSVKKQLVTPTLGYIDNPIPHPTENKIAYEINDNTNGAYGGTVGLGIFDETTGKSKTVLEPAKHFNLYDLIGPTFWMKSELVTLRQTPQQEGTWLADAYKWDILKVAVDSQTTIYKKDDPIKVYEKTLRVGAAHDGNIELIDDNKLVKLAADGKVIESIPMPESKGMPSPDDKLDAILGEDDSVEVTVKATGQKYSKKLPGQVQTLNWAPDSKRLLAVVTKNKLKDGMDVFDRDSLVIISLPPESN